MPRLLVGYTELAGSKLEKGNGFLQPNFGVGPNRALWRLVLTAIYYYPPAVVYSILWKERAVMLPILFIHSRQISCLG